MKRTQRSDDRGTDCIGYEEGTRSYGRSMVTIEDKSKDASFGGRE